MRLIINLVLIALVFLLCFILYSSIREPIEFKAEQAKREQAVIDRLMQVRVAQEIHRDITGKFADSFDSLVYVLKTGKLMSVSVFGDPDDPTNSEALRYDTTYEDAMVKVEEYGLSLDSLSLIPFGGGKTFDIQADTLTYQKTLVNVVEVGTQKRNFMGPYADARFARYDDSYDPDEIIKFGNMNAPNTAGNWER